MDVRKRVVENKVLSGFVVLAFLISGSVAVVSVAGNNMGANPPDDVITDKEFCEDAGGEYLEDSGECTGIEESTCDSMNGEYTSCGSPCRNNPDADMCITSCVQVCELSE